MMSDDEDSSCEEQRSEVLSTLSSGKISDSEDSDTSTDSRRSGHHRSANPSPDTTTTRDSKKVRSVAVRVNEYDSDGQVINRDNIGLSKSTRDRKGDDQQDSNSNKKRHRMGKTSHSHNHKTKRESESASSSKKRSSPIHERTMSRSSNVDFRYSRNVANYCHPRYHAKPWEEGGRRSSWSNCNHHHHHHEEMSGRRNVLRGCQSPRLHNYTDHAHFNRATTSMHQQPTMTCHHCNNGIAMTPSTPCVSQRLVVKLPCHFYSVHLYLTEKPFFRFIRIESQQSH